jgi:CTP:molybdopterin cytidylyltransferase MocA
MTVTGIVLAAGAGTRMGIPKALKRSADAVPWIDTAVTVLEAAGCAPVFVVLGAAPDAAVPPTARVVFAEDWDTGMAASLRAGLATASGDAALVTLVDLPGLPVAVAERIVAGATEHSLAQAVFGGRPGHPVLIGSAHWNAVSADVTGDRGARGYLVANGVVEIECGDLWDGADIDS